MTDNEDSKTTYDIFELMVAILLGLSAIGTAWAGFQGGLWGGMMATSYGEAATLSIKAATEQTEAFVDIGQDFNVVSMAKKEIAMGRDAKNPTDRERAFEMANYLYTWQLSPTGYKALGLPAKYRSDLEEDKSDTEKKPAPKRALPSANDDTEDIPEDVLIDSAYYKDLDDDDSPYFDLMLASGKAMFAEADQKFQDGKNHNATGDKFSLDGVIYTIALFFAGLALVFKSKVRWLFFALGGVVFIVATGFMFTIPWASL